MLGLIAKAALTAIFIVALSEIAKRWPSAAGLIVALPLATAMTMVLMHFDGEGASKIAAFAWSTLVFAPPSFVFLGAMLFGMWMNAGFWPTLAVSVMVTAAGFALYVWLLNLAGVSLSG
jgi:hypothetical protein